MNYELFKSFQDSDLIGNELKSIIQELAIDTWLKENKGIGYLQFFTGSGKTTIGCRIIERFFAKHDGRIGIIVPTKEIRKEWIKRLGIYVNRVEIFIINSYVSLKKPLNREWDILIVDELHRICNEDAKNFSRVIQLSKYGRFCGLTATLDEHKKTFLAKFGIRSAFEFTLQEGYALGLVPHSHIYNISTELNKWEDEDYDKHNRDYNNTLAYFNAIAPDDTYSLIFACQVLRDKDGSLLYKGITVNGQWRKRTHEEWAKMVADYYNITIGEVIKKANIWRASMTARNAVLDNSENKREQLLELIQVDQTKKTIIFTDSIDTSDFLETRIGKDKLQSIHSKLSDKIRDKKTEDFKKGLYNQVVTVKAFDEGIDLPSLQQGINNYFTSKEISFQQRFGRILRYDASNPDKVVNYINQITKKKDKIYQDEVQLKRAQKGFESQVINIKEAGEISWIK